MGNSFPIVYRASQPPHPLDSCEFCMVGSAPTRNTIIDGQSATINSLRQALARTSAGAPAASRTTIIDGQSATVGSLHQALANAVEAHLHARHRAPCAPKTKLLFARMDFRGVGNDLNSAIRAFACALAQDRQVVFLPPSRESMDKYPWLKELGVSWQSPWHWLHRAGLHFDSLLVASSCQLELLTPERRHVLMALAEANDTDAETTLTRLGETALAKVSRLWRPIWRVGLGPTVIPSAFRSQGLLWWFQALGSYLIRARGSLRQSLNSHEAMKPFRTPPAAIAEDDVRSPLVAEHFGQTTCTRSGQRSGAPCDGIGVGWHPRVWFDLALHIRMGDVCGKNAPKRGQHKRKCSPQPLQDALRLMHSHGLRGNLFFASDSAETVDEAMRVGPSFGFNVTSLAFDRSAPDQDGTGCARSAAKNSTSAVALETGLELCKRSQSREQALLVEALLDVFMLSRSSVLVGAMMSNFPRLALQTRLQASTDDKRYLALDGRDWCTRTSCRMNYTVKFGTA